MRGFLLAGAFLLPVSAYAGGHEYPGVPVTPAAVTPAAVSPSVSSGPVTSSAASHSASHSSARVTNTVTVGSSQVAASGAGSGDGGGGSRAPDVVAPSISGGNPCSVGGSAGGSGLGGGGVLGFMWESHECSLRQTAAILANMGMRGAALETLCRSNNDVRWAMRNNGTPCADDVERWRKAGWRP